MKMINDAMRQSYIINVGWVDFYCVGDNPRATLTPDELHSFVLDESADISDIDGAGIEDRSKGTYYP